VAEQFLSCAYPALSPPIALPLITTAPHPCPYLPNREATLRAFGVDRLPGSLYHRFLDASFRRTGNIIYQPVCRGCRACQPLRVPVERFQPSKSQRRCWRRNQDLRVAVDLAKCSDEKWALYAQYQSQRHGEAPGKNTAEDRQAFESFLYSSPVDTIECTYRDMSGKLLGVGICDVCSQSLSSMYFFFDPSRVRRGLGIFGVMWELDYARRHNIAHYYLGFWINGCRNMKYKTDFRPYQILCGDGQWRDAAEIS